MEPNNELRKLYTKVLNKKPPQGLIKKRVNAKKYSLINKEFCSKENIFKRPAKDFDLDEGFCMSEAADTFDTGFKQNGEVLFVYKKKSFPNDKHIFFHLCWCKYLAQVKGVNLKKYFAATSRHDGYFLVETLLDNINSIPPTLKKLVVCKECFNIMRLYSKGYSLKNFNIQDYYDAQLKLNKKTSMHFRDIQNSSFNDMYVYNWREIREFTLKLQQFTCQRCKRKMARNIDEYKDLIWSDPSKRLEVHHKDRNKRNNSLDNLEVLCMLCHDREHPNRPK